MPGNRSIADRLIEGVSPRPVVDFAPAPEKIGDGIWILDRRLRMPPAGLTLQNRTTIVRAGGGLVVISPPSPDARMFASIDALGTVASVVAPNSFHHLYAPAFAARYPAARLLACPGLRRRVPGFPPAQELGDDAAAAWNGELELVVHGPVRGISEVIFFHVPTRTLILTDFAFNMTSFVRPFDRLAWRLSGVPERFGPSRTARLLLLRDRAATAKTLQRILEWPLEHIVVAHGEIVERDARAALVRAYARWL